MEGAVRRKRRLGDHGRPYRRRLGGAAFSCGESAQRGSPIGPGRPGSWTDAMKGAPDPRDVRPGAVVRGPVLPEALEVLVVVPLGGATKIIGRGLDSGRAYDPVLTADQLADLTISAVTEPFDGDAVLFRLGIEAHRLGLAYEYDPYFSLSIARVDPLPHQLEAVYDYFLKVPRIRFLLADDPGAGKTIMAGLLLKELKARGLVKRTLIVAPANLTFQWQRELQGPENPKRSRAGRYPLRRSGGRPRARTGIRFLGRTSMMAWHAARRRGPPRWGLPGWARREVATFPCGRP